MVKIEITGDTPLEALASLAAFGLRCTSNEGVYAAASRILEAEEARGAAASANTTALPQAPAPTNPTALSDLPPDDPPTTANPQVPADLPPEPYVEDPPHGNPTPETKPEAKPPKLEEVRAKGMGAARKHGQPAIKAILEGFGVASMTNLAESDRAAFLEKLAQLEEAGEGNAG